MTWFFLDIFLSWFPAVFLTGALALSAIFYFFKKISASKIFKLIIAVVSFRIVYAAALTFVQYYVWSQNELTKILARSPLGDGVFPSVFDFVFNSRLGYFLFYSYGRFWLSVFISIAAALVFYLFLRFLRKYRDRFFEEGEAELGFLTALIVGWPNFVIFVPMVFISVIIVSIFRRLFYGETYTMLGIPFLLAALTALLAGSRLIHFFRLEVLNI